jgi:DNA-binding NarL/FixJ family response regulator
MALRGPLLEYQGVATAVLLVDDNAGFRSRARRLLEADGFVVVAEAADGQSALALADEHLPAVVLLDVKLPDMSGLDVAERLARASDPPTVVLTSTYDIDDFRGRFARCGARGFVPKAELSGKALAALLR